MLVCTTQHVRQTVHEGSGCDRPVELSGVLAGVEVPSASAPMLPFAQHGMVRSDKIGVGGMVRSDKIGVE